MMNLIKFICGLGLVLTCLFECTCCNRGAMFEFNLMNYGARSDGNTDNSKAIMSAWEQACKSVTPSLVVIPQGNYLLGPVTFEGPCKAPMTVQVQGTLRAPSSLEPFRSRDGWINFKHIDHLTIIGGGKFDGGGQTAWKENHCAKIGTCSLPINIRFTSITNGLVQDITSLNSKMFHINILNSNNITLQQLTINAPSASLNTDGIHIGRSNRVNITDIDIKTGDDCISLGDGTQHITIDNVTCRAGHGISIGSLGRYRDEQPVVGITVRNCNLTSTLNGVRVKTWPGSFNGSAIGLHFEDIFMNNVSNPIVIDQDYCPSSLCKTWVPSRIKIRDVMFKNIKGTSATPMAIQLRCSKGMPCEDVKLNNVNLKYIGRAGMKAVSQCSNVKPTIMGKLSPSPCLLS